MVNDNGGWIVDDKNDSRRRAGRAYRQRLRQAGRAAGVVWGPVEMWAWVDEVADRLAGTRSDVVVALLAAARAAGADARLAPIPPRPRRRVPRRSPDAA